MFEIESRRNDEILIKTASRTIAFDLVNGLIKTDLAIGEIKGAGEFEIGEASIRGIAVLNNTKTIYDIEIGGVRIGIIGDFDETLDELGISDILCTSSTKAIREINPKLIIATGNIDGMVTDLKLSVNAVKKVKIKKLEDLPKTQEIIVLN